MSASKTLIDVPPSAFEMSIAQLAAWERLLPPQSFGAFMVVRGDCEVHGRQFSGYVLPSTRDGGCYLAGWLAGLLGGPC